MNYNTIILKRFRPLSGNLLSLPEFEEWVKVYQNSFSSPIGESTFSTAKEISKITGYAVFVPYRGIYFLYTPVVQYKCSKENSFRPLSGNLLSLHKSAYARVQYLLLFSSPIGESTFSTLPLEPLCLSGFRSCFAGQNLKIVFLFLFLMLAPLFPLFYAVRRKILFTAGKTLFFPFPYHIIFLDISCICIHAVQLQGLRPLHVYAVHTL